jgi:hypothetical protein
MSVTVETRGIKEIGDMFGKLPARVNKAAVWGRFWKKVTVPLLTAAVTEAPLLDPGETGRVGVAYRNTNLTVARGTLKKSLQFYRTKASKDKSVNGAYIGPRVKGKFKKNKGGYYGAWVEYGHKKKGGGDTTPNDFMMRAWNQKSGSVLADGFSEAEKIYLKAVRADVNRLKKYGRLGY